MMRCLKSGIREGKGQVKKQHSTPTGSRGWLLGLSGSGNSGCVLGGAHCIPVFRNVIKQTAEWFGPHHQDKLVEKCLLCQLAGPTL